MSIWKSANPTGAIADFMVVYRQAGPRRWRIMLLAIAATCSIFSLIAFEEYYIDPRPPEIIYINSWRADRSDTEIRASNRAHQRHKEALAKLQAEHDAKVKAMYKAVGRASGMDVDKIEREAQAAEAAEQAEKAKKLATPIATPTAPATAR
jgi:hypothetical protein